MNKSDTVGSIASALALFQGEMRTVVKDAVNPYFKSKYADLSSIIEAIREPLKKNGLAISQFPSGDGELTTILMHGSGEWIEATAKMGITDGKSQSIGSAMTYARRYALGAVLGIATDEDDDGHAATQSQPAQKSAPTAPAPTPSPAQQFAPCDNADCLQKANLRYGKLCYPCSQAVKSGSAIKNLRSEGAVASADVPPLPPKGMPEPYKIKDSGEEVRIEDIPF